MKKSVKALLLVVCAVALVVTSVFATLAYMTSQTKTITNTFTVGNVAITMDEAKTDLYGVVITGEGAKRVDGSEGNVGNQYKLIPGKTFTKDPTIHFTAGSEAAYLFVKVENGISAAEAGTTIAEQMTTNGWVKIGETDYYYYDAVAADDTVGTKVVYAEGGVNDYKVFGTFTLANNIDPTAYASKDIKITAYAVQADGFTSATDAWTAAQADLGLAAQG